MLKIVVVGDAMIGADVFVDACSRRLGDRVKVSPVDFGDGSLDQLQGLNLSIERSGPFAVPPPGPLLDAVADADALLVHKCPVAAQVIAAAPQLRVIGINRTACENVDVAAATARHIPVVLIPGRNAQAVAEYTFGLILAETRNIARSHASVAAGQWRKTFANAGRVHEMHALTLGLVGLGQIGRRVMAMASAFDMAVVYHDPLAGDDAPQTDRVRRVELDTLLSTADIISLHARSPKDAPPIIAAEHIATMKRSAYIINTARAHLIDEAALYEALETNRLAGAALDVFWDEPLGPDSRWRKLDNVTVTAHLAGSTYEAWLGSPDKLLANIAGVMLNYSHHGLVNPEAITQFDATPWRDAFAV